MGSITGSSANPIVKPVHKSHTLLIVLLVIIIACIIGFFILKKKEKHVKFR